ncbi:MAG: TonB-dependent receptor [Bacteroidetes bacterium]|nr:TonB-dependent receptor [Bacteroidota bacterium]
MKKFFCLIIFFLFLIPLTSFAQTEAEEDSSKSYSVSIEYLTLEDLLELGLVSSSKIEQRAIESPSVISVITSQQIEEYGWISANNILSKQPGFGPAQDYDRNTVSSRGFFEGWNNNHILMLVDGIPMNDNLYGSAYTWEISPLIFAKNIEVLRGPGSALYGSNATNGVVQINTISASDLKGAGKAETKFGNNGKRVYNFIIGNDFSKFSIVSAFSHSQSLGNENSSYDGSGETDANGNPLKFVTSDQRQNNYFWTKITGKDNLSDLSLQYHYQQWEFQTGHGWLWFAPDFRESMKESRQIISLNYSPQISENVSAEFLARYQIHNIDWNTRFYREDAFGGYYPAGMWEYLDTKAEDLFARAQLTFSLDKNASILTGIETDFFFYNGDNEHYSNIDVDVTAEPFADNRIQKLGPWLDYINGQTVKNVGVYGQFMSGDLLADNLSVTLGARYDVQFFDYNKINTPGTPTESKDFSQFSPRVALVYMADKDLALKAMWGKAFRAPSPTEMFGAHTWTLGSNIEQVKPEIITTAEFAVDWIINKYFNWRTNIFHTKFENQIAYSAQNNNLSTNVYSLTNQGFETELLFGYEGLNGFLNFSYVKRVDEEIQDITIAQSEDLTWEPPMKINFGASYHFDKFHIALSGHFQAAVDRRDSDKGVQELPLGVGVSFDMDQYRGPQVDNWFTVDFNGSYKVSEFVKLGVSVFNLFDKEYFLVKNIGFPFDYQQTGRRYTINCALTL